MDEHSLSPIHPGQILMDEFIIPGQSTVPQGAEASGLPLTVLEALIRGESEITRTVAAGLAQAWRTTPEFWLNLQSQYETRIAGSAPVIVR